MRLRYLSGQAGFKGSDMLADDEKQGKLYYHRLPDDFSKEDKLASLASASLSSVTWRRLTPNKKHTWLRSDTEDEFERYLPIGTKAAKKVSAVNPEVLFKLFSGGVKTNRDQWVYDFAFDPLAKRMRQFIDDYNTEVMRYSLLSPKPDVDGFVNYSKLKWDGTLKNDLRKGNYGHFNLSSIRDSLYRPFTKKPLYFDRLFNNANYLQPYFFPTQQSDKENRVISVTDKGSEKPFMVTITNQIPDLHIVGPGCSAQCFPFYTYDADGSNRCENITDWALGQFRARYADPSISKWDIFYYVYGLLHHPGYRERYALDLKRSLPRIPFAPATDSLRLGEGAGGWGHAFAQAGRQLADLHLNYESADRYELDWEATRKLVSFRVEKMLPRGKVNSADGSYKVYSALKYNDSLTLRGIPERAFAYRLGNRSALDWIVDQYRVKTDKRSGITHDPNGYSEDPLYILKLIERVITVSLRTVDIVDKLAALPF